jgi:hypothetical protein
MRIMIEQAGPGSTTAKLLDRCLHDPVVLGYQHNVTRSTGRCKPGDLNLTA